MSTCDCNCFHCPFPECVSDEMSYSELRASDLRDQETIGRSDAAVRAHRYYMAHRENVLKRKKEYYRDNREKILARKKSYNEKNRDAVRMYQHEYYLKRKRRDAS